MVCLQATDDAAVDCDRATRHNAETLPALYSRDPVGTVPNDKHSKSVAVAFNLNPGSVYHTTWSWHNNAIRTTGLSDT
jgi:hypothetical protein